MTDDLVKRLREAELYYAYGEESSLGEKAADRIEQLEAALQLIADACAENEWPGGTQQIARAALEEKKDGP